MKKTFVFANNAESIRELTAGARQMSEEVVLVTSATVFGSADVVYTYSSEQSVATRLKDIAAAVCAAQADAVLCESGRDGKLVAGYVAAKLGTSPLCDASSVHAEGGVVEIKRLVYGGSAVKTERVSASAVVVVLPGVFAPAEPGVPATVSALAVSGDCTVEQLDIRAMEASQVNLAAAKRVVGAGRGIASADNLPVLEQLARLLGAEIGCTRPVAEEEHWYAKDRYIGVSGCMIKPKFYLAVGISGQIQHMVGVNQANVIFSIDKNENAPIISQADYCLIGDVTTALPAIIEKLSAGQ